MLTPLLLTAQLYLQPESTAPESHSPWYSFSLVNSVFVSCLAATWAIHSLAEWDLRAAIPSIAPALALGLVYLSFLPKTKRTPRLLPHVDIITDIYRLAPRAVLVLVLALAFQTYSFSLLECNIVSTLALSFLKALSWYFTIRTVRPLFSRKPTRWTQTESYAGKRSIMDRRHNHWNVQPHKHHQPLRPLFRSRSPGPRSLVLILPRSEHPAPPVYPEFQKPPFTLDSCMSATTSISINLADNHKCGCCRRTEFHT